MWVTEALHGQRLVIVIVIFETVIFAVRSEFGFSKYTEKKVHCNTFSAFFSCLLFYVQDSGIDIGDISERKALRKKLQCKTFRWYLVSVYPEMRMYSDTVAYGVVRTLFTFPILKMWEVEWCNSRGNS